jgi:hypothetical protein
MSVQYPEAARAVQDYARGCAGWHQTYDVLSDCSRSVLVELVLDLVDARSDEMRVSPHLSVARNRGSIVTANRPVAAPAVEGVRSC